jgi:hypothetical protein
MLNAVIGCVLAVPIVERPRHAGLEGFDWHSGFMQYREGGKKYSTPVTHHNII